jgi:superfamily II DNA or RNA helicase
MDKNLIQEKALKEVLVHERCGVAISMGVGKTLLALKHVNYFYKTGTKILVVYPKKSVMASWKEDAMKFGYSHLLDSITFTTYISLKKQHINYDLVYLDECHNLLPSHEPWLKTYKGKILGLTGTPPKSKASEKYYLVNTYCPIVYEYITDDAISDKILNDYKIFVHMLSLDGKNTFYVQGKKKSFPTTELNSYNYWSDRILNADTHKESMITRVMRMKAMQTYPSKERYAKHLINSIQDKCILFCNTQDQADKLCDYSYHSSNSDSEDNLEMFKSGHIDKLSCVLQLSEGVNIPNLKHGVVMHAYGNERKFAQRLGRLLRLNPDDLATAHILCYQKTVDEDWVSKSLEAFDNNKIQYVYLNKEIQ